MVVVPPRPGLGATWLEAGDEGVPSHNDEILEFQCPKCGKRLKAGAGIAGKRVKCPKCEQPVKVPGVVPARPIDGDDWLSLGTPAITDLAEREKTSAEIKAAKERARATQRAKTAQRRQSHTAAARPGSAPTHPAPVTAGHSRAPASQSAAPPRAQEQSRSAPQAPAGPHASPPASGNEHTPPSRPLSIFDEDLPELAALEAAPARIHPGLKDVLTEQSTTRSVATAKEPAHEAGSNIDQLDYIEAPPRDEPLEDPDPEYRILCKTCGTAQYVKLSMQGMKIKCPDCYENFKIPPPHPGWSPKKKKAAQWQNVSSEPDIDLAPEEQLQHAETLEAQRLRAAKVLERAKQEVSEEDIDRLYDGDFDTAGFMQRTFGFLKDPVAVAQIVGYGVVFAAVFALAQFGVDNAENGFGRGILLLAAIGAPILAVLFGLPMLSGGLALVESVANRQERVDDWVGFNLFDNFGDVMAIAAAMVGSVIPGFMVGSWLGSEWQHSGLVQITGMMATSMLLFPIFLLSILDNGSLFQPLSGSVLRSLTEAKEAWGGYFLKTLCAFFLVLLLWYLLLGKHPATSAAAGALLPLLIFFTCQQIGALADSIAEHLSFEFTPHEPDDSSGEEPEPESRRERVKA